MSFESRDPSQELFKKLKSSCVPLLGSSNLTPATIHKVSNLLSDIAGTLQESTSSGYHLTTSIISYVFFPISTVLRRNNPASIPDQVLEKLLRILSILSEDWWWDFDEATWEQLFMLCSSILGGLESKGKGRERDNETKEAAASCLWAILHDRTPQDDPLALPGPVSRASFIYRNFKEYARKDRFTPILGQSINHLLLSAESLHLPLQIRSLQVLHLLVRDYISDGFAPSILPGVVSAMCKVSLGVGSPKGWANGDTIEMSLDVLLHVIIRSISDDICIREGALKEVRDLEDLTELFTDTTLGSMKTSASPRYETARTPTWLQGTSSQLHIALNSLHPLVSHRTPSALRALAKFSASVLASTLRTLPQSRTLLASFLLVIESSDVESASKVAKERLIFLLSPPSDARHEILQALLQILKDNLSSLPRFIRMMAESKAERAALIIAAICDLGVAQEGPGSSRESAIAAGAGLLLGPNGGIERWGWRLLSVLEFVPPRITSTRTSAAQLMLETGDQILTHISFPEFSFRYAPSSSTYSSLERMFHSLGRVAREDCLFSVEWFLGVGQNHRNGRAVAALWCAARLLEGIGGIYLGSDEALDGHPGYRSRPLERFARELTRTIAESWDQGVLDFAAEIPPQNQWPDEDRDLTLVEYVSGLTPIRFTPSSTPGPTPPSSIRGTQPLLHMAASLQLLAVSAGILQARFSPLLLQALYPILHSLISPDSHLSTTALATLQYVSNAASYASPANMLLSNFDYALDAVSRRLNRRWLDVDATRVLLLLVRFVGRDVVQRAADVVEECFDRLDEYHGYEVIVDGLIAVLAEVVGVVASSEEARPATSAHPFRDQGYTPQMDKELLDRFLSWFSQRGHSLESESEEEDIGPVPRRGWANKEQDGQDQSSKRAEDPLAEPPQTPTQELTKQIVTRSMYFLTHKSALVRSQILTLLGNATSVLPESAILPCIHQAWPFILNRFSDPEPFVISAAAQLVESLATHVGDFMSRRIWGDIWPRFRTILSKLDKADASNALARRGPGAVGTESAYTHSHRLYRALLVTMCAAVKGVQAQDNPVWEIIVASRRFLHDQAHDELQACARELYIAIAQNNEDAVWFALSATQNAIDGWRFLEEPRWNISKNAAMILG